MTAGARDAAGVRRRQTMRSRTALVGVAALLVGLAGIGVSASRASAAAPYVSSVQQIEQNKKWDGKTITFRGEAIGDILWRGDYAWVNVNDDAYQDRNVEEGQKLAGYNSGQSIWVPSYLAKKIVHLGDYWHSGDKVQVTGVFNAACPEHGGDMDIHASSLIVVRRGHVVPHPIDWGKALAALLLLGTGGVLFQVNRRAEARAARS